MIYRTDRFRNRLTLHACKVCGKERYIRMCKGIPVNVLCWTCARSKPRKLQRIDRNGYVSVYLYKNNPFYALTDSHHYVTLHRLLMAQLLASMFSSVKLAIDSIHHKTVHHIDGNILNNRWDNLLLCSNSEHTWLHRVKEWGIGGSRRA